jgi:chemotaxis response regulator CheB
MRRGLGGPVPLENDEPIVRRPSIDMIVIGGSAGSMVAVRALVTCLPKTFPCVLFILQHASPEWSASKSAELIQARTAMPVRIASDFEAFRTGFIYIGQPNHHLTLEQGVTRLEISPKESFARPSIDVLFRSAAANYGRRVVGVLLSGTLNDGTAGLWQIKKRGGIAIVQQPSEAEFPGMPGNAIANVAVDYVLRANAIGEKLVELVELSRSGMRSGPRPARILIVEDEPLAAQNLREILTELSYVVVGSVSSGEEAIRAAAQSSPDLTLMDIKLAGKMSGIQAARQIREAFQVPVLFVTAHGDLVTLTAVKATDHYGYLVKPFHSVSVQAAVELALDKHNKELLRSDERAF